MKRPSQGQCVIYFRPYQDDDHATRSPSAIDLSFRADRDGTYHRSPDRLGDDLPHHHLRSLDAHRPRRPPSPFDEENMRRVREPRALIPVLIGEHIDLPEHPRPSTSHRHQLLMQRQAQLKDAHSATHLLSRPTSAHQLGTDGARRHRRHHRDAQDPRLAYDLAVPEHDRVYRPHLAAIQIDGGLMFTDRGAHSPAPR